MWVGVNAAAGDHRGGQLVITTTSRVQSVDPAFYNEASTPQFIGLAYDELVTFEHTDGSSGLRLVPDLATSIPSPSAGGRTYTFRIRPGIHYSDGRPVRADDFRRAIERLFRLRSPGAHFFAGLAGARRCTAHPASCDLSAGIVSDDSGAVVTFHLTAPDPDFLFKLTESGFSAPIPPGPPERIHGAAVPPGTGPYRIVSVTGAEIRFARNPFFHEWSHTAQPTGNPNAIVWRFADSTRAAVTAVQQGRADWFFGLLPRRQYRQLQLNDPAQLHSSPQFGVEFIPLNTHRPPFNDIRVRHALNDAIDRGRIARMYGGTPFARPTCQPLIPGLPGYRRYCPYTLDPRPDGAWTAPNLVHARQLVAESGTRGARIDVWGSPDEGFIPRGMPAYVASVLRSLGYRVRLHVVPFAGIREAQRRRFQLSVDGDWLAEYPDPSSYVPQFFACGGGTSNGYFCDPRLDRRMALASRLEPRHPEAAMSAWASIDHELTNRAPWVPTVTERDVDVVSSRLRNYEYNPVWGFLVDQSWID
jgi:peptide/nickel transport system substrate-binding protein